MPPSAETMRMRPFVEVLVLAMLASGSAWAQSRGELLYTTHCQQCHAAQVHWRAQRSVTDWASLRLQVGRWQANAGLNWSDDDVRAVARYLNALYYRFQRTEDPVSAPRGDQVPQ